MQTLHAIPIREADVAAGWVPWLLDAEGETTQFTKFLTLVQECRLMRAAASAAYAKAATVEADDELPQPKTAAPAPATTGSAKDPEAESLKQFQTAAALYNVVEQYTNVLVPSDQRISYSVIYKENENWKSGHSAPQVRQDHPMGQLRAVCFS
jgi:hypothetical protein